MPQRKYLIADQARARFITAEFRPMEKMLVVSWTRNAERAYSFDSEAAAIDFEDGDARDFLEEDGELTTIVYSDTLESIY